MNKLIKKAALMIPFVKKYHRQVVDLRNQVENLRSQNEQIKVNYELQHGTDSYKLKQLNSMFEDNVEQSWSTNNKRNQWICMQPFSRIEINMDGSVSTCCPNYLKYDYSIGNAFENSFDEIWNSDIVKKIRYSVSNGCFEYCNKNYCNMLQNPEEYPNSMLNER